MMTSDPRELGCESLDVAFGDQARIFCKKHTYS